MRVTQPIKTKAQLQNEWDAMRIGQKLLFLEGLLMKHEELDAVTAGAVAGAMDIEFIVLTRGKVYFIGTR